LRDSAARCDEVEDLPTVGLYGKLPCRGDFLRRRLPLEFVEPWDSWLQECLAQSRQQLQEHWLDAYLVSPVWRFALAGGACAEGACAGVLLPSVDLVGRYFPLTLVARWKIALSPLTMACSHAPWFDLAQALALEALEAPVLDFEDFDGRVASLGAQWQMTVASSRSVQSVLSLMAFQALERRLHPVSLWWTEGSEEVDPVVLCVSGLPDPDSFAGMLSGQVATGCDRGA
jgi:type VI secretion system protein ImpM